MKDVILLGTDFLFTEELGSRLRGINYIVHPFDSPEDLELKLESESFPPKLMIIDIQRKETGGVDSIKKAIEKGIKVIAIGAHKDEASLSSATEAGASLVLANSQASRSIENFVEQVLKSP